MECFHQHVTAGWFSTKKKGCELFKVSSANAGPENWTWEFEKTMLLLKYCPRHHSQTSDEMNSHSRPEYEALLSALGAFQWGPVSTSSCSTATFNCWSLWTNATLRTLQSKWFKSSFRKRNNTIFKIMLLLAFQLVFFLCGLDPFFLGSKKPPHNSTFEPSKLPSPQAEDHEHTDLELHHFHKISTGLKPPVVSQKIYLEILKRKNFVTASG